MTDRIRTAPPVEADEIDKGPCSAYRKANPMIFALPLSSERDRD